MSQQNFSYVLNTTAFSEWTPSLPMWAKTTTMTMPNIVLPSTSDMTPYAVFYFLSGAVFFLGSAIMILGSRRSSEYIAIDGIATMSDFTKTNIMKYMNDYKPSRELVALVESNGMDAEEFLNIVSGNVKRHRRPSAST